MKKLKVILLALLAASLTVGLVACRKKPADNPDTGEPSDDKTITTVLIGNSLVNITDADTKDSFISKVSSDLSITVRYSDQSQGKYSAADCDYDVSSVRFGEVGNYTVKVTPKTNNPDGKASRNIDVTIGHDFKDNVCSVDGATRTTQAIDVGLEYKLFHAGDAVYSAADDASKAAIHPFGNMSVDGREEKVKSYSVGRLEKGMSITVKGTAETTYDELGVTNLYYFFPILGFADTSIGSYTGGAGTSVIVRNEGWVLLDGIGNPRLLAGKAAGGGGANDSGNYGSHPSDTGEKPDGYEDHGTGTPSYEDWKEWFTYSTGTTSTSDTYLDEQEVEFTWTYLNNGIIELVFNNLTSQISLTARTKVPDSSKGYYDTILHGEYVKMHFTEITTVQTTTLTGVSYGGLKADARKVWLDNEMLDLNAFNVTITTEQSSSPSADTQFDIEANIGTAEAPNWVSLSTTPLDGAKMKAFRVTRTMGNVTKTADIDLDNFITIKTNAVDRAVPYTVEVDGTLFANNDSIADIVLSAVEKGADATAKLTVTGRANSLSDGQKAKLAGVTANKYVALRLWAREGATANFKGAAPVVKCGDTALAGAYVGVAGNGEYVDLIIPVDASVREKGVVVSGLVAGGVDVEIDLSGLESVSVTSQVQKGTLYLNKGGDVTVVYSMSEAEYAKMTDRSKIYVNGASARFNALSDTAEAGYDYTGMIDTVKVSVKKDDAGRTVTVKYTVPKFSIEQIEKYDLVLQDGEGTTLAQDSVYYDFGFDETEGTVTADQVIHVEADGTMLHLMIAADTHDLRSEYIMIPELMLNMNDGTKEGLNFINFGFLFNKGALGFINELPEGLVTPYVTMFGTIDNGDDYDKGIVIILAVDVAKLGYEQVPYFFEVKMDSDDDGVPESVYMATQKGDVTAIEEKSVTAGAKEELGAKGGCLDKGYTGYKVTVDGKDFYAGVAVSGGMHHIVDGVCLICGSEAKNIDAPTTWWDDRYTFTIGDGEFVDIIGRYSNLGSECGGNSSTANAYAIVVVDNNGADGTNHYVMNGEGLYEKADTNWANRIGPKADYEDYSNPNATEENDGSEMWSSLITEEHPYDTLIGWIASDGNPVDAESFNKARIGATFRYMITYSETVLTVNMKLYKAGVDVASGTPYVDFTYTLKLELTSADSLFLTGMADFTYKNSDIKVLSGRIDNLHHTHEFGTNGRCTHCGMLEPEHVHDFHNRGVCICGDLCKHEHVNNNVCADCDGVWTENTVAVDAKYDEPVVWVTWHEIPVALGVGQQLTVTGTQTGEVANNWETLLWEIKEGFTGRLDAWGWEFGDAHNFSATYSAKTSYYGTDGEKGTFTWELYKDVAKDCQWTIHFERNSDKLVDVQVSLFNETLGTVIIDYVLTLVNPQEELHIHFTSEKAPFTVASYTHTSWQYPDAE